MFLSVIICSCNRQELLRQTIDSVLAGDKPADGFELIVVDNNSTDGTREMVLGYGQDHPQVVYAAETRQGLCHARNRGIAVSRGEILIFLDDDIIASRTLLAAYHEVYRRYPEAMAAGGRILLNWEALRPPWLRESDEGVYTKNDLGENTRLMAFPESPFGANMSFKRSVFEALGEFDPLLSYDARKGVTIPNDDLDMSRRLYARKWPIVYAAKALVHHRIMPDRAREDYFHSRLYGQGVADARLGADRRAGLRNLTVFRYPFHIVAYLRAALVEKVLTKIPLSENNRVLYRGKRHYNQGYLREGLDVLTGNKRDV